MDDSDDFPQGPRREGPWVSATFSPFFRVSVHPWLTELSQTQIFQHFYWRGNYAFYRWTKGRIERGQRPASRIPL